MPISPFLIPKTVVSFGLVVTLAACGGSSTGGGTNPSASFADIAAGGLALADEIATIPYTDPTTLPAQGSASYDGFIGVDVGNAATVAGDLTLNANFGSDQVSGSASNFFDEAENAYGGTLDITQGTVDRGADTRFDFTFTADLTGDLTDTDGAVIEVDADIEGDFTGTDYQYVEGFVSGTATVDGEPAFFDGEFVGER